jgi:hypothetical protein
MKMDELTNTVPYQVLLADDHHLVRRGLRKPQLELFVQGCEGGF